MSGLPAPMTPAECDLRGFMEWTRFFGEKAFKSHWYRAALKDPRGGLAAIKLWWTAMLECPAGSLPNDEEELCWMADFGQDTRSWRKHRAAAMHGFVLCADNRWYHPFLAEEALAAWDRRVQKDRTRDQTAERTRQWRQRRTNGSDADVTRHTPDGDASHTASRDAKSDGGDALRDASRAGLEEREKRGEESTTPTPPVTTGGGELVHLNVRKNSRAYGTNPREIGTNPRVLGTNPRAEHPRFPEFWDLYPRPVARPRAVAAFNAALVRGATPNEIISGLMRHRFPDDHRYCVMPAKWLSDERWKDGLTKEPDPVLAAVMRAADRTRL